MPISDNYTQRLGLAELDVYLDTPNNDVSYFNVSNLPQIAGYGKHSFQISYNDPEDTDLLLKQGSGILFELVDSNGETVFSELSDIPDANGAASAYFWIKKDPLWVAGEIADGPATLYVVGELDNVPEEYVGTYNIRTAFTFDIRKSQPNTSRILFYDVPALELSSSINGTIQEFDLGSNTFARGYIEVSASHMETHGGQVNFIELSYLESGSRTDEFTPLTEYPLVGSSSRYEISESVDGLNPISHVFKTPVPRDFRRDTQAKFRLRFLDANKSPAKYYDEIKNDQIIEITSSFVEVSGTPFIIEKEDNLLKGSMYTGNAVGKGFEQSGKNSAFLKTVDYTGFKSASLGIGSPGVMFFSGSVLTSSGDDYTGVGLELVANSESFFKFRSNPSVLDVRADAFFVGSTDTQFISASGGVIEISSSNFHLSSSGDVTVAGTIEAAAGTIGGFEIQETQINSTNDNLILKAAGQISASSLLLASGSFIVDPDNLSRFGQDGFQSFVMLENTGVVIQTSNFNLNTSRFIISSSDVGVMAVGSTPPLDYNNGKGFYVDGDGNLLVGDSQGPRIQFDGFDTIISSSNFFLGSGQQFVSGSLGNIEISSSNFHLDATGNVNMAGTITAEAGEIGGFSIGQGALSSDNFFISGAATGAELFISSSGFSVDAEGVVSASDLSLSGGSVGGLKVEDGVVSVGEILKLKDSGQITGSQVLFTGGKIAAFNLSDDAFSTDSFFISASATNNDMFISSSNFNVKASGDITGSEVLFTGGKISGSDLKIEVPTFFLGSPSQFVSGSNGNIEITSSNFHLDKDGTLRMAGTITATAGKIAGWTISGDTLVGNNATLDGAGAALFRSDAGPDTDNSAAFDILRDEYYIDFSPSDQGNTNNYYVKFGPNFAVDVDGVLHASGAQFEGTVSASKGIIGGFTTDGSSFSDNNGQIFISGSPAVGGVDHPSYMFISSSNFNVKQNGDVTGSQALFTGGKVGGWIMTDSTLTGGVVTLNSAGSIEVGGLGDATTVATTNSGFFADSSGNVLIKGNVSNNDYLKISSGGGIDIKSQTFDLDAGTIVIDSGTNDGKIALGATPNTSVGGTNAGIYMDGTGDLLVRADANNFIKFDQDASPKLLMKTQTFFLGGDSQFLSGSNGNIEISSSNFHLDAAGNVDMSGTITATAGKIAGFTISGDSLTATNFEIDASGKRITLGDASSTDLFVADADEGIQLGNNTFGLAPFSVTKGGVLKAVAGTVGGYGISSTAISSSNDNLILKNSGQITGSTVLFTGGKVGGFKITSTQITSSNLLFDSGNSKLVVGSANKITIQGGGTDNFITMGSKTAFAQTSTAGVILGMDNNVPSFDLTRNATNYMRFDTSTGVDIKTDTFKLDTATLDIDSSTSRIQVVNGSSNEVIRFGEISDSASDLYGIKVYDGSGTADSNILVKLGGEGNTIGGWTITNDQIQSQNLVIHSSGRLETADFASGVKGWRIDSEGNGTAEFENATIRGTLSTAVFEKESVNAVGGQLYVANSTVLSGSGITSASFTTMSVENVSGFVQGEIASLKKVSETGFTTEYIFIDSASRNDRTSDTDFSGDLFVIRGYSGSLGGVTGSLGGAANSAQDYNPGQVLVSTGRVGTGYIRLNANPNDSATPYIDIVERTGSAIYDIELKTRVGDLSGLSSATLFGNSNPGFGIFTENGFFKGGINATTGSFTGVVHINTSANEIMKLGTNVNSTNDGIHINNNNYWYTDSQFKVGDANSFILHDGNGDVKIISENFTLKGGNKLLMTSESLAFDTSNASTATRTAGTGVFMNDQGHFRVGVSDGNRLTFTGTSLELVTDDLNIDTSTFDLSTDGTGKIALGATPPTDISSGTGFFVDGAGNFLAGNASGNFIRFNQSSGAVQVAGEITIGAGSTSDVDFGAGAAASASAASASAALAETTALEASSSAGEAISTATNASASAAEASSSAVTATAAASTAQSAIDDMETQVVLNNDGMDLRNESNLNLVSYGTTTKFFDGVGDDDGNMKLRLNTDGVFAFANTTESFARFYSEGVQIVSGSVERAKFAETTTIGNPSFEHVEVTSASLKLKGGENGSITRLSMDADGMQIGSVSNGITLNASGDATFNGSITIAPSDLPSGTVSGSAQLADAISGSIGDVSASIATNVAAASSSAGQGISSANTATAAASTAQGAIDEMETQVVLTNEGMSLRADNTSDAALNGQDIAQFGTTTKFFDGVDDTDANQKLRLNADGVFAFANTTQSFARFFSEGVQIVSGGVERAKFAATTTIGNTSFEHVEITETSLKLKDGSTERLVMNSSGMQIGTVSDGITLNSDGEATFNGTITLPSGTVSGSAQLADAISGSSGADSASLADRQSAYETQVQLSSDGMALKDGSGNTLANYGTDVTIGRSDALNQNVFIDSDSVDIRRGTQVTASFGATTTIGPVSSAHTFIDSGSLKLKDGSNERLVMDANGIRMGSQFSVAADGTATFGGTLTVSAPTPAGTVSSSAQLADAISGSSEEISASLAAQTAQQLVDSASMASSVQLTNEGLNILNSSNNVISEFGADVFVGLQNEEHVKISETGLELKDNNDVVGKFVAGGATIGKTTGAHVSASTTDVHIIQDANNKAVVDASGLKVIEGGNTVAQFAATTVIGSSTDNVTISSDGVTIEEGNDVLLKLAGGQVIVGNDTQDDDKVYAVIKDTGLVISSSTQDAVGPGEVASFGETTTIGRTAHEHVKITSAAIEIKTDANTTVLSASSAGLEMSGKVIADAGKMGGFKINQGTIIVPDNSFLLGSGEAVTAAHKSVVRVGTDANVGGTQVTKGFFASGSGFMRVGSNIGENLTFDPDVGLTVSSSNFNISAQGDVTMSGNISAAGGDIAGLVITPTQVSKGAAKTVTDSSPDTGDLDLTGHSGLSATDNLIHTFTTGDLGLVSAENATITGFSFTFSVTDISNITSTIADNQSLKLQVDSGTKIIVKQGIPVNVDDTHTVTADVNFPINLTGGSTVKFYISNSSLSSGQDYNIDTISSVTLTLNRDATQEGFVLNDKGHITGSAVKLSGDITATGGNIGGYEINGSQMTGSGAIIVTSGKDFTSGNETTRRTEMSDNGLVFRTWSSVGGKSYFTSPPTSNVLPVPTRKVFDLVSDQEFTYFQGETLKTSYANATRAENIEFGRFRHSGQANPDTWETGSILIGQGGKAHASIRSYMNDSDPVSAIFANYNQVVGGWVAGDKFAVQPIGVGNTVSITNDSYTFSVVGTSYFSGDVRFNGDITGSVNVTNDITVGGNAAVTGDLTLGPASSIIHGGDTDTKIVLTGDDMSFQAGSLVFLDFNEVSGTDSIIFNEGGADINLRIETDAIASFFKIDAGTDRLSLNEATAASLLHIQQTTDNDDGAIRLYNVQDGNYWSINVNTSEYLYFLYNGGSNGGYIRNNASVGAIDFTGQHRSSPSIGTVNNYTSSIGYIVCADGTYDNLWDNNDKVKQDTRPNINESIPRVKLSSKAKDKTVFGVISDTEDNYLDFNVSESISYDEYGEGIVTRTSSSAYVREYSQGTFTTVMEASGSSDQKLIINSIGEGAIWISNYSGSLENGDYITTSPIEGLGMKQDDDLLHNYTVAKITQDCDFDLSASGSYDCIEFEWSGSTYRRAFVGCTYHCG